MRLLTKQIINLFLLIIIIIIVIGCSSKHTGQAHDETFQETFHSFTEIPGITPENIAAIESLKKKYEFFTFGMIPTTEAFQKENGEIGGYDALLCEWLTSLFGIQFKIQLFANDELLLKLNSGEIDFSGNMIPTAERRSIYSMTDTIAERKFIKIRLADSESPDEIQEDRPVRYALAENTPMEEAFASVMEEGTYETINAGNFTQAYSILLTKEADAYIASSIAEAAFTEYDNIIIEDFFPLIFNHVSMATAKKELEPVIEVINLALRNGSMSYLSQLYNKGYADYKKYKMSVWLTPEERDYIERNKNSKIPIAAFNNNYPLSFYNKRENKWQGIYFDIMEEASSLTGLAFEVAHNEGANWPEINALLTRGEAAVVPELVKTKERENYYIWTNKVILYDYYALVSKIEYRNISLNDILHIKVGMARNTIHASMFKRWFPNHVNIVEYDGIDQAFKALTNGEVDMVMTTQRRLMHLTHYQEIAGYKTNLVFNQPIETRFAFNKDEKILKSIIDKSLKLINLDGIIIQWTQKTYDYRVKLAEAQRPWLFGAIALTLVVLLLTLLFFLKSRDERKKLARLVEKTNEANRIKNVSIISMETILNSIDAMIYVTDPKTAEILFINDSMKKHYNISGDCTGKLCYKILQKDFDRRCSFCPCFQLDNEPDKPVIWEEHSTLTKRIYHNTDRYIAWPNGQTVHMQHSVDTTDLVEAREFAERSSRYKTSFLANMSHEIRTPMNAILGIAEIQLHNENLPDDIEEAFNKIYESGDLLINIINDILDLSKIEAGKLELVSVKYEIPSLINDTAQINSLRYESKPILFSINIDEKTPHDLYGDELRIKQILNNILSNAFKYTEEGKVEFSVSFEPDETESEYVTLVFCISDTGQGMTKNQINSLFDEYSRFNPDLNRSVVGTGLGMNITMLLINLMNGSIDVQSEPGKGSVFTVRIPQKRAGSAVCGIKTAEHLSNFKGTAVKKKTHFLREYMPYGSVLVVDDVESNIYVTKGMLMPYGLNIEAASSGFEVINKIKDGSSYDIIFMDHMMPKMDGIETTKILRSMGYTNTIIALTANALIGREEMFLKNGFDAFISKPVDSRELNLLLNDFIRNKKPPEVISEARKNQHEFERKIKNMVVNSKNKKTSTERETLLLHDIENAINVMGNIYKKLPDISDEELELYVTTVHGIKSVLINIGERELSDTALKLEKAGDNRDMKLITDETETFLNSLLPLIKKLKLIKDENEANNISAEISSDDDAYLRENLLKIKTFCEAFDKKAAKALLDELRQKTWTNDINSVLDEIALLILHSAFKKAAQTVQDFTEPLA
ncbi:MAG: transporter substrate-binding domain-containing protein [Treponema sp.]|nr:transporter substrate-binding domain-containing protein [Treponema sp.]